MAMDGQAGSGRRLEGKLAVITGGASGIGRAGAELFAEQGASVVVVDINARAIAETLAAIEAAGGTASGIETDLSAPPAVKAMIDDAVAQLGGIDILWNNAGMPGPAGVEGLDFDEYRRAVSINLDACVLACGEVIPHMRRRGGGAILFTSSVSGLVGSLYSPTYSAAKFALVGLTKSLAQRCAPDGIRVNAICPGPIDTPMLPGFFARSDSKEQFEENQRKALDAVPLRRLGRPREIAQAALWLASDDASYVTGVALPVDGGYTCK